MARIYNPLDNWLSSVGIALLVLSVVMVPTHGILANTDAFNIVCTNSNCNDGTCAVSNGGQGDHCTTVGCGLHLNCSDPDSLLPV